MSFKCNNCSKEIKIETGEKISFKAECESCGADLHICLNCHFHDIDSYNECRETQAERVVDKEKANYCDYFQANLNSNTSESKSKNALDKLNSIFKN